MKKNFIKILLTLCFVFFITQISYSQCSICTKTAEQLGEGPAKGLNIGIIYLMMTPFVIIGYIGFRWWKNEKAIMSEEN